MTSQATAPLKMFLEMYQATQWDTCEWNINKLSHCICLLGVLYSVLILNDLQHQFAISSMNAVSRIWTCTGNTHWISSPTPKPLCQRWGKSDCPGWVKRGKEGGKRERKGRKKGEKNTKYKILSALLSSKHCLHTIMHLLQGLSSL